MSSYRAIAVSLAVSATLLALPASAYGPRNIFKHAINSVENTQSTEVSATGKLEVAFSPNEGSEHLVVKAIDAATKEVLVLAYSFTSAPVTEALIRAVHRGATVRIVADAKSNINESQSKARAALSALKTAGADVRTISVYPIHHDKVIIVDRATVELGSFNYSAAAAHSNSENVLVNWNNPALAEVYIKHFSRNYVQAVEFRSQY